MVLQNFLICPLNKQYISDCYCSSSEHKVFLILVDEKLSELNQNLELLISLTFQRESLFHNLHVTSILTISNVRPEISDIKYLIDSEIS